MSNARQLRSDSDYAAVEDIVDIVALIIVKAHYKLVCAYAEQRADVGGHKAAVDAILTVGLNICAVELETREIQRLKYGANAAGLFKHIELELEIKRSPIAVAQQRVANLLYWAQLAENLAVGRHAGTVKRERVFGFARKGHPFA